MHLFHPTNSCSFPQYPVLCEGSDLPCSHWDSDGYNAIVNNSLFTPWTRLFRYPDQHSPLVQPEDWSAWNCIICGHWITYREEKWLFSIQHFSGRKCCLFTMQLLCKSVRSHDTVQNRNILARQFNWEFRIRLKMEIVHSRERELKLLKSVIRRDMWGFKCHISPPLNIFVGVSTHYLFIFNLNQILTTQECCQDGDVAVWTSIRHTKRLCTDITVKVENGSSKYRDTLCFAKLYL